MDDRIFESFLRHQEKEAMALAESSDLVEVIPLDGPPPHQRYIAKFRARGLVRSPSGEIVEANGCDVGIWLPSDYLRVAEVSHVFTYLGPPRPWHPNIMPPFICVHIRPGTPLVDLLYSLFELWTYHLFATGDDGLNKAAAQWARRQDPSRFPIDRRPLKRRVLNLQVDVMQKEERP